jgi:hypothetical protein
MIEEPAYHNVIGSLLVIDSAECILTLWVNPVCRESPFLQARLDRCRTKHLQVLCPETNTKRTTQL